MFAPDPAKASAVPSIGWAAGIDRLALLLQEQVRKQHRDKMPRKSTKLGLLTFASKQELATDPKLNRKL